MFVIIGWLLALACIFGVFIAHGGNISVVLHALPFEMTTIFGAAIGGMLATNPPKVMKATMKGLGDCFKGSKYTKARYMELLALLYDILQKARKEGLMSIEKDVEDPHSSPLFQKYPTVGNDHHVTEFITDYLRMMVSGNLNAHEIESLMDAEIDTHHHEAFLAVIALQRLAGALEAKVDEAGKELQCIKTTLLASMQGYAPQVAIEFGRKVLYSTERPTFAELEGHVKKK